MRRNLWLLAFVALAGSYSRAESPDAPPKKPDTPRLDPVVVEAGARIAEKLRSDSQNLRELHTHLHLFVRDGIIYEWDLEIDAGVDFKVLAKAAGVAEDSKPQAILTAWTEHVRSKVYKLTIDAVKAAGTDPGFNAETDVSLRAFGRFGMVAGPVGPKGKGLSAGDFSMSFTGSRLHELSDNDGVIVRPASGDANGGEIKVELKVDKKNWKPKERITGHITIRNVGKARVHLDFIWARRVSARTSQGVEAKYFSNGACALPVPDLPTCVFLEAGREVSDEFEIQTDRSTAWDGYILDEGSWLLHYADLSRFNIKCECPPAEVEIVPGDGK